MTPPPPRLAPPRIGLGLAAGVAILVGLTMIKLIGGDAMGGFRLYLVSVLVAAWYGGTTAGLGLTVVSGLLAERLFLPARGLDSLDRWAQVALYLVEGAVITLVTARLQVERRRAAAATSEARAVADKLEVILRAVDEGITVQDPTGKVIYANDVAARLSGFATPEAFLAATSAELSAMELRGEDGKPFPLDELPGRVALAGGNAGERLVRFHLPGQSEERWSLVRANPVRDEDGKVAVAVNIFRDVTERRRHEDALRLGREWLSTALRSIGDAVITTDRSGQVSFLNPAAALLTGWAADEALGRPLREVFVLRGEVDAQPVEDPASQVVREGRAIGLPGPTLLVRRDGSLVSIDDSAAPIRDAGGELVGVVLVFRDVTAKRREEERRAYLARATLELNTSLDVETTLATVARLAVPSFADWCAVDLVEDGKLKRLAVAHVDPAKLDFIAELERRYPSDPETGGTARILRSGVPELMTDIPAEALTAAAKDAEHLRLIEQLGLRSFMGVPVARGGKVLGVISFAMAESNRRYDADDLSLASSLADRVAVALDNALLYREAERARRDSASERDRLAALIMASPTAIAVLRAPEMVYELMNEPYRARMGRDDLIGRSVIGLVTDERLAALAEAARTGESVSRIAQPIQGLGAGDGVRYVTYTVHPLRDAAGRIDRVVLFTADVTDEVQARQRIEAARAEAEAANRSKDEFLAMLGHELRNPLAPIQTAIELMRMHGGAQMEHERSIIARQVKHLVRLVDDLLDVSRIARGKVDLNREPLELAVVVRDAVEIASPLLEERHHHLNLDVVAKGLGVLGDRARLTQVVANLVNNAAKYTRERGDVTIRARREGDEVVLTVRDNGIGISAEMLPRVFDLFVQEQQTIERSQGGLGLGLTIVKNLVQLHGGRVRASSEGPGQGSELEIRLPAVAVPAASPSPVATPLLPPIAAAGLPRVLVVDDNEDAAELLAMLLETRGFQVRVAHDGPQALVVAGELRPGVALVDIGLPVMDGFEVARRLRADVSLAGVKLIAVTGYGQDGDRERSRAAGFDHHLVKPVDLDAVLSLIAGDGANPSSPGAHRS